MPVAVHVGACNSTRCVIQSLPGRSAHTVEHLHHKANADVSTHKECSHKLLLSCVKYLLENKLFPIHRQPRTLARAVSTLARLPISKRASHSLARRSLAWDPSLERAVFSLLFMSWLAVQCHTFRRENPHKNIFRKKIWNTVCAPIGQLDAFKAPIRSDKPRN